MSFLRIAAVSVACFFVAVQVAPAQNEPLHVLASNGMKAVIEELRPKAERAIGHPLDIQFGSTTGLKEKIAGGAPFDVAILTSEAITGLVQAGKLTSTTQVALGKVGIGLAVRAGVKKPDISTEEALKQTLVAARSITYAKDGASRVYLEKMFDRLGIFGAVQPNLELTQGSDAAMESVAAGKVSLVMTLMSELMPVRGIDIAGPLPPELQSYVKFGAAVHRKSSERKASAALIAVFRDPSAAAVYKAKGMEQIQ